MTPKKLLGKRLLLLVVILVLSLTFAASHLLAPLIAGTLARQSTTIPLLPSDAEGPINPLASHNENVTIFDLSFNPCCLCIEKGDTINWTNNDPLIHTLWFTFAENQSTYLLSDLIPPGQSWTHTFTEPKKFTLLYYSFKRLWITGTIKVFRILGDFDDDGDVDPSDFAAFAGAYGTSPPTDPYCDFDCDNYVGPSDFAVFAGNYGRTSP